MKINRLILLILAGVHLFGTAFSQENSEIVKAINAIKLNSDFIYGEATMKNEKEASQLALARLSESLKSRGIQGDVITSSASSPSIGVYTYKRADMTRSFMFINMNEVSFISIADSLASAGNMSLDNRKSLRRDFDLFATSCTTFESLQHFLGSQSEQNIESGFLDINTGQDIFEDSYLVFLGKHNKLLALYTPSTTGQRINLLNGKNDFGAVKYEQIYWIHM